LRRPLGTVVQHAEREHWADSVGSLFTFGKGDRSIIFPTLSFDSGLLPTVGVYFARDGIFAKRNELRVEAATWGEKWLGGMAADRFAIDRADSVDARLEFLRAQDNVFLGIGPDATIATQSRYGLERMTGSVGYQRRLADGARIEVRSGVQRIAFIDGSCCDDPALGLRIADGQVMTPPGYGDSYTVAVSELELSLDSRRPPPEPASGAYLRVHAKPSFDLDASRSWTEYGGVVGGSVDVTGHQRTLSMQLGLDFVDSMTGAAIPFTEYPTLGGELMPGFIPGWMLGRSTAAAQLGYTWPVWLWLSGQTRFTIGNAFGEHLEGLGPRQLRMSGDIGITTRADRGQGFEILVGAGTETFAQGADITSVRVTFGTRRGFW
jgi:hypothetical protein